MIDPYHRVAGIYDRLFDNMNKGLRLAGIRMFRPASGMNILDVGCGTGAHLELYRRYDCHLYGIDLSPAMLAVAQKRLGPNAQLDLGNATRMTYPDQTFDLVFSMLTLHEMDAPTRLAVIAEMARVLKPDGRVLLIDFHPGPYLPLKGWISKLIISISELAAGRKHFQNYRQFIRSGGLELTFNETALQLQKTSILAGGTFAVCLIGHRLQRS